MVQSGDHLLLGCVEVLLYRVLAWHIPKQVPGCCFQLTAALLARIPGMDAGIRGAGGRSDLICALHLLEVLALQFFLLVHGIVKQDAAS